MARSAAKRAAPLPALPNTPEIASLRAAYAFAAPIYAMMRARHVQLGRIIDGSAVGVNRLLTTISFPDATSASWAIGDGETLYASAWLDLAGGPVILDAPSVAGHYTSAALIDLFTDNVVVVGSRTGNIHKRHYLVAGPTWQGDVPAGLTLLRATTNDSWLLVRVGVAGPGGPAAATGLVREFTLDPAAGNAPPVATKLVPTANPDAEMLIAVVDEALARSQALPGLGRREFHELGVSTAGIDRAAIAPATMALWRAALPKLRAELADGASDIGDTVDGWSYPPAGIGEASGDDAMRARIALRELGALPRAEAVSLTAKADQAGATLSGTKAYIVHLPAQLPVGAGWSLTMYSRGRDGRRPIAPTPSRRSAVGQQTPELRAERDGGFEIFVQAARPSGERVVNWLPAPPGPFELVFRAYVPKPELLNGSFRLPPVEPSEVVP